MTVKLLEAQLVLFCGSQILPMNPRGPAAALLLWGSFVHSGPCGWEV